MDHFDNRTAETRKKKRPNGTFIHFDNFRSQLAQAQFDSLGIHSLGHPSYSPDITPCDFWLFGYVKRKLEGVSFAIPNALVCEMQEILDEICITE
jgi:hypothetical protein